MAGFAIANHLGQCYECGCRYRPGEMIVAGDGARFHADCYRTRGSWELRPYEDQQPVELDLLLIAIRNDGVSSEHSTVSGDGYNGPPN
ncbi:MAG TPA: hypothetical protein VMW62_00255 [Chloroflexota bacterium]|nr:hypothetical protein [Chloroflexota bacterium]